MRWVLGHEDVIGCSKLISTTASTAKHPSTRLKRQSKEEGTSLVRMAPPRGNALDTTALAISNVSKGRYLLKVLNIRRRADYAIRPVVRPLDLPSSLHTLGTEEEVMRPKDSSIRHIPEALKRGIHSPQVARPRESRDPWLAELGGEGLVGMAGTCSKDEPQGRQDKGNATKVALSSPQLKGREPFPRHGHREVKSSGKPPTLCGVE